LMEMYSFYLSFVANNDNKEYKRNYNSTDARQGGSRTGVFVAGTQHHQSSIYMV